MVKCAARSAGGCMMHLDLRLGTAAESEGGAGQLPLPEHHTTASLACEREKLYLALDLFLTGA